MKKFFLAAVSLMMAVGSSAQFYIYLSNGEVLKADSISMVVPNELDNPVTPDVNLYTDYSNTELVMVGTGVVDETAQDDYASGDGGWAWGKLYPMGKPAKDGDVYTWTVDRVRLGTAEFKFRSNKTSDVPYVDFGINGGYNTIILEVESDYKVVVTIDAVKDTYTTEFTKLGNEEVQKQNVTVKFKLPADWTNTPTAWVWPTGGAGEVAALTQNGDWWVYTTPEEVVELNIIVRNGDSWAYGQTIDIDHIKSDVCYQISTEGNEKGLRLVTEIDCE